MKFNASLALIVICGLVACSQALPSKRLAYYQQPAAASYYAGPQRMMFMRYVQPSNGHARSHQAAAALVAGESGSTGTYLQGSDGNVAAVVGEVQEDTVASAAGHVAHSVAEAYPAAVSSAEEEPKVTVQVDLDPAISVEASDNDAKEAREYNFDAAAEVAGNVATEVESPDAGLASVTVGLAGSAESKVPDAPVLPAKRYLPAMKKVIVELEQAAGDDTNNVIVTQADDEDVGEENDDAFALVPVAPKVPAGRRPVVGKLPKAAAKPKPLPVGTFFPVDFGGATGGAISIANSFSTGEGGSASSHAISYGNPDQARAHLRPSRRH